MAGVDADSGFIGRDRRGDGAVGFVILRHRVAPESASPWSGGNSFHPTTGAGENVRGIGREAVLAVELAPGLRVSPEKRWLR